MRLLGEIGQNLPLGVSLSLGRCQVWVREAGLVLEIGADYAICSFWENIRAAHPGGCGNSRV